MSKFLHIQKILFVISTVLLSAYSYAQKVDFTVEAPAVVEVGENFRVVFKVNANPERGFEIERIEGAQLISGPQRSQSTSMSYINGRMTTEVQISETYIYRATQTGTLNIKPARIQVDGRPFTTRARTIEVVATSQQKQQAQQQQQQSHPQQQHLPPHMQQQPQQQQQAQQQISGAGDIFAQVSVNKRSAYVGEPIYVSLKLYTKHRISNLNEHSYPNFSGFFQRDIELPQSLQHEREIVNGEEYFSLLFKRIVIFPQRSGEITISPFEVDCNISIPIGRSFWGLQYQQERRKVASNPVTIHVKPLPSSGKPSNFNGAVGSFTVQASTDAQEVNQNDAFTYKITVRGTGNLSLLQPPSIQFPPDFEVFDPKINRNHTTTVQGERGTITYEYVIIPRREGSFTIPAVAFAYFDLASESYKTASTSDIAIQVARGQHTGTQAINFSQQKEDVRYLHEDILYIKTKNVKVHPPKSYFFGSVTHYAWYGIPSFLLLVFAIMRRKQIRENQDIARVRTRKANKESRKCLKIARACLEQGNDAQYYDEIAKALWGYVADKYTISLSVLNKETISDYLQKKSVAQEHISELLAIIEQCELARFAPASSIEGKETLYTRAADIIQVFEQIVK